MERLEEPAVLLGRRGECALIGAFPDRPADDTAPLLRGEPGTGKTVLLDAAADGASAANVWVLRRPGGVRGRVDLFRLNQLLVPVYEEELHELSAEHLDAPKVVPGFGGPGTGPASGATRQERSEPAFMACEAWPAPRLSASRRGHLRPAAAWAVAGRTGGDKRDHLRLGGTR